jgi:hypothetical protein
VPAIEVDKDFSGNSISSYFIESGKHQNMNEISKKEISVVGVGSGMVKSEMVTLNPY